MSGLSLSLQEYDSLQIWHTSGKKFLIFRHKRWIASSLFRLLDGNEDEEVVRKLRVSIIVKVIFSKITKLKNT